jgi:hypothetical protein
MHAEQAIHRYLREEIFPQISPPPYGKIETYRLSSTRPVYLFVEKGKNLLTVGKSFKYGDIPLDRAWSLAEKEYTNLKLMRDKFGMDRDFYEIVAPLGEKKELGALLVTRNVTGHLLEHYIARAIYEQRTLKLYQKLGYLARFFFKLHRNTRTEIQVSPLPAQEYLNDLLSSLRNGILGRSASKALENQAAPWWNKNDIFARDTRVIIHGDATPTNFFLRGEEVTGIDLERMRYADRCWDLGFIAAELKHHFWWRTGDKWAAEPFIGHFLWEYALKSGNTAFFYLITRKLPLYMALGLLRIARNIWLAEEYRKALIEEARLCLQYGL